MSQIWSPAVKFSTWRRLWLALATAEKELGLDITDEQLAEMKEHLTDINYEVAEKKEEELKHDVMAHIYAWGLQVPKAAGIIHLGATSQYVNCNTDIIQMKMSMRLIQRKLLKVIASLRKFSNEYKGMPTLGYTHFQAAQLVTVGKRATLWLQDFLLDFEELTSKIEDLPARGVKGTTGTQASFLSLFDGDHEKVKKLNLRVCELMGLKKVIPVSGQTYTRKLDFYVLSILSAISQSAYKLSGDIRLLMHLKEIEEPFGKNQVGSSAMAYKRNPMRSERVCALARYVQSLTANTAETASHQWFERTLDDSANRRIVLPQAFLAVDIILKSVSDVVSGLQVWPNVIHSHVMAELPFMATENILMACVKAGGNRQELHELIREHSMEAGRRVKEEGVANDLIDRIRKDAAFKPVWDDLDNILNPVNFIGRCSEQVDDFLSEVVDPLIAEHKGLLEISDADIVTV